MKKSNRKADRYVPKSVLRRQRFLGLEPLEARRLLAACTASDPLTEGTFAGHTFEITSSSLNAQVINIPADSTSQVVELTGNIRRGGLLFPPILPDHNPISIETPGFARVFTQLPNSDFNRQVNFRLTVTLPAGSSTVEYRAVRDVNQFADVANAMSTFCINRTPSAQSTTIVLNEDTVLASQVTASDADGDGLTFSIITQPNSSQTPVVLSANGSFTYQPNVDFFGSDSFTYQVSDGQAQAMGTISLTINPVNDAPRFTDSLEVPVNQGSSVNIDGALGVTDPEGDAIDRSSILISSLPSSGTAVLTDVAGQPMIVYTPNQTFQGVDEFEYTIADAFGARSLPREVFVGIVDRPTIATLVDDSLPISGSFALPVFTNDRQPIFVGTAEAGAMVRLLPQPGLNAPTVIADASGNWQIALASPLPTATQLYTLVAEASSMGVPPINSNPATFTIDITAPNVEASLESELRPAPLTENVVFQFTEAAIPDPVTGFAVQDLALFVNGTPTNLLAGSEALLVAGSNDAFSESYALTVPASVTDQSGTYTLALNAGASGIADRAGNLLSTGFSRSFAVDVTAPKVKTFRLESTIIEGSKLSVPVIEKTTATGAEVSYAVTVEDQQFAGFSNTVFVQLVSVSGNKTTPVSARRSLTIPAGTSDNLSFLTSSITLTGPLPVGQHELKVLVTDASGNVLETNGRPGSTSLFVFVSDSRTASSNSPATPVDTSIYFLGARLTKDKAASDNVISVNQAVRSGTTLRLLDEATGKLENRIVAQVTGSGPFELSLAPLKPNETPSSFSAATTTISWLRPWTMSFDKTTQTTWFTNEDGHYLGQLDPATGSVNLYDVVLPGNAGGATSYDPHGVFFDFNTHLTPRVWFVYRNGNGNDGDTPVVEESVEHFGRLAYFDLVTKALHTFDLSSIKVKADKEPTGDGEPIEGTHAVFIDTRGHAWISAEGTNAVIEIDLQTLPNGTDARTLNASNGSVLVHTLPKKLGDVGDQAFEFQVHGIQVIVDQRTNEPYVWLTDGNRLSTGRLVLLRPGSHASNPLRHARSHDQWFEWSIDEALISEGRLTAIKNPSTGQPTGNFESRAHPLFLALDDNETPGVPEDDRIIISDGGALNRDGAAGVIRSLDANNLVGQLATLEPTSLFPAAKLPPASTIASTIVPKIPGALADNTLSAPTQTSVDRTGSIYFIDTLGSIGRLNFDDSSLERTTIQAPIRLFETDFQVEPIQFTSTKATATSYLAEQRTDTGAASVFDRAQVPGVDQYELAQLSHRGRGEGGFRFVLTAENTAHISISQSDHVAVSIFAESNRRQLAVVPSPFALPTGAVVGGRAVLQVLRDGSVILTARGDGELLDVQVNLTKELFRAGKLADFDDAAVLGDIVAISVAGGGIEALGRRGDGSLIRYRFQPTSGAWKTSDLSNIANWTTVAIDMPSGQLVAEDPAPAPGIGFTITTAAGHLFVIPQGKSPIDLSAAVGSPAVFAGVGGVVAGNRLRFYGSNQQGGVVEYSTNLEFGDIQSRLLVISNDASVRPHGDSDRDLRIMRNIRPLIDGSTIHLFANDGTARLVHYELDLFGQVKLAENVTRLVEATDQVFGYFNFQRPFGGRVYTYLSAIRQADGSLRVYGTNGGDLVEFTRAPNGAWRVGNLTNDIRSTHAIKDNTRIPANAVFGAPNVYQNAIGERHILQINVDGEIVEYYTLANDPQQRFHSQNVNLRIGNSSLITNLRFRDHSQSTTGVASLSSSLKASSATLSTANSLPNQSANANRTAAVFESSDVNADGEVSAVDVLVIINYLNTRVRTPHSEGEVGDGRVRCDVSGDGLVSPLDALVVINHLHRRARQAEGEAVEIDPPPRENPVGNPGQFSTYELVYAELSDIGVLGLDSKKARFRL